MMLLRYPRCCVVDVQAEKLVACSRQQDGDDLAHTEVRTFGTSPAEMLALSEWLAGQGVTHVAMAHRGGAWKLLYAELLPTFTVEVIEAAHATDATGATDVRWLASLFAHGLIENRPIPSEARHESPRIQRLIPLLVVAGMCLALATTYGLWSYISRVAPNGLSAPAPSSIMRWQQQKISATLAAGQPFTVPLPTLERSPESGPIEITLDAAQEAPSWLQLDRERHELRGTIPLMAAAQTYWVVVRAHAQLGEDSRVNIVLTVSSPPAQGPSAAPLPNHWAW